MWNFWNYLFCDFCWGGIDSVWDCKRAAWKELWEPLDWPVFASSVPHTLLVELYGHVTQLQAMAHIISKILWLVPELCHKSRTVRTFNTFYVVSKSFNDQSIVHANDISEKEGCSEKLRRYLPPNSPFHCSKHGYVCAGPSPESFQNGGFAFVRGDLTFWNFTKTPLIYSVSCFNLRGLSSAKPPPVAKGLCILRSTHNTLNASSINLRHLTRVCSRHEGFY